MTLRLIVDEAAWRSHVRAVAASIDGLVPVVKGNGYGFGRSWLATEAAALGDHVCVGTVHELEGLPPTVTPVVLTPSRRLPARSAVLTVGVPADVAVLDGWGGSVIVKLRSTMGRFGASPDEVRGLFAAIDRAGLTPIGTALHLGLAGDQPTRRAEVEGWLGELDDPLPLWLSHLDPPTYAALRAAHPRRQFRLRLGTALWHGDKRFFRLCADVLALRPVGAGERVGYRASEVPGDGTLIVVGAGSAQGIAPLAGGLSPFHHARRRMALLEPPHMHCSLVHVPIGEPLPDLGAWVDVQRPLIEVTPDEIDWASTAEVSSR